jgi:DNA helicase IV
MKYSTGFLSSFIISNLSVETGNLYLNYRINGQNGKIAYQNIDQVSLRRGLVWDEVEVISQNDRKRFEGLSGDNARKLVEDLEKRISTAITSVVADNRSFLSEISDKIEILLREDRYLSNTDVRRWMRAIPKIGKELSHPYFDPDLLPEDIRETVLAFIDIVATNSSRLTARNEEFVKHTISAYEKLFSNLEKYPLTLEQKRAAVINEDRNLLIAAAGSGKSSTIVAKAIYLIESRLAKPEEILVLAYNKDAQLEIDQRLGALVGISENYNSPILAKTFHGLGMDIIAEAEGQKPSISEMATAGRSRLANIFIDIVASISSASPSFAQQWLSYLVICKSPSPDLNAINTFKEYQDYLRELGASWQNTNEGRRLVFKGIDGTEVKSMEELRIVNWLVVNGVNYEYEKVYPIETATETHRQYRPDFYYPEGDIYHEHFALNAYGKSPPFFDNYEAGVIWKRALHIEKNTQLMETHSAHFNDGSIFEKLETMLNEHKIEMNPKSIEELNDLVGDSFNPANDTQIFSTFLRHFKSNNASIPMLREKAKDMADKTRANLFLDIFEAIHGEYQNRLSNNDEIDFEDQINTVCELLESNKHKHDFKYILVDEFQDISQDRKRMIHALLDQDEQIKLFAVGDDWQSIYRFSGADIDIMTHFADHFGVTSKNNLTETFRSFRGIVDVSAEFVQRNPLQLRKQVTAKENSEIDQVFLLEYLSKSDQQKKLVSLLRRIEKKGLQSNKKFSVFLLTRYNHLKPDTSSIPLSVLNNLDIEVKSIHASKGLEADYVILLNVESGYYGFLFGGIARLPHLYKHSFQDR